MSSLAQMGSTGTDDLGLAEEQSESASTASSEATDPSIIATTVAVPPARAGLQKASPWMEKIQGRFGQVKDLEKRLDIMEGLDPLMDGIIEKMNEVTDHSNIVKMQTDSRIKKADARIRRVLDEAKDLGYEVKAPVPLTDSQKEERIKDVVARTLQKVEG